MKHNKALKLGDAVRVAWVDSYTKDGWRYDEAKPEMFRVVTQGFVVANTKELLGVSSSMATTAAYVDPIYVPWCAVRGLTKLGKRWNR